VRKKRKGIWSKGYRHQEVNKIITITVIVEKVEEREKNKKGCIGRICMEEWKKRRTNSMMSGVFNRKVSKKIWENRRCEPTVSQDVDLF
jgi:hypothetical protein